MLQFCLTTTNFDDILFICCGIFIILIRFIFCKCPSCKKIFHILLEKHNLVCFVNLNLKGNENEFFRNNFIIFYCNFGYSYLLYSKRNQTEKYKTNLSYYRLLCIVFDNGIYYIRFLYYFYVNKRGGPLSRFSCIRTRIM